MSSLSDLHLPEVTIVSDFTDAIEEIQRPSSWPRYRIFTENIRVLSRRFSRCCFDLEKPGANLIAREIAKSVTREGLFQSYLALGGPSWLHVRIQREAHIGP